ncbi:MAG TPA: response regulator, partial [Rhizomicrobium sp.]
MIAPKSLARQAMERDGNKPGHDCPSAPGPFASGGRMPLGDCKMRILLIEDNAAQASGIKPVLRSEGFDFNSSEIDKEGVELGKRCDYDVIILDRSLSDMNGLNVLKALRAAKVHAPVLVLSGDASTRAMVSSLDAGADDYITKPYHKAELVARICAVARRSRVHPQSLIAEGKIILNL